MKLISSANIACGRHAGDHETMRRTVELALQNGVAVGAHPSYPDPENFGRRSMDLSGEQVRSMVADQIVELRNIAASMGASLVHVKPHGALYNTAARDAAVAAA